MTDLEKILTAFRDRLDQFELRLSNLETARGNNSAVDGLSVAEVSHIKNFMSKWDPNFSAVMTAKPAPEVLAAPLFPPVT